LCVVGSTPTLTPKCYNLTNPLGEIRKGEEDG